MKKNAKKIKALLLDLDGTLLDTAPDFAIAINQLRKDCQLPPLPFSTIRPHVSDGTAGMLGVGLGVKPDDPEYDGLKKAFLAYYQANLSQHTRPFPGILALLAKWEAQQGLWGIVTNKPGWLTEPLLVQQGLSARLSCVVSGDTLPVRKPSPLPLLEAAKMINLTPQDCLYVGDNLRDIQSGRSAEMLTIAASYGYLTATDDPTAWQADYMINYPEQIWSILDAE